MIKKLTILVVIASVILAFGMSTARAEQNAGIGSQNARLNFAVNIPSLLLLRVGSAGGTIDTVTFNVTDVPENQPTVSGDISPLLRVGAITLPAQTVTLIANSSTPMNDGGGHNMPFSTITYTLAGDFAGSAAFNGTINQQIWQGTGSGLRNGSMSFVYANSYTYPQGNYTGQITFTLSSP